MHYFNFIQLITSLIIYTGSNAYVGSLELMV